MDNIIATPPQRPEAASALVVAKAFKISSSEDYQRADALQVGLAALEKLIVADFDNPKRLAAAAHRAICEQEKGHLAPVQEARRVYKGLIYAWDEEQEKLRKAEEAELQRKAQALADEQALAEATLAEQSGDAATAEAIINTPVQAAPVVLQRATPKAQTVVRKVLDFRVTDQSKHNRAYLVLDPAKVRAQIRASGKDAARIVGGIDVYERPI